MCVVYITAIKVKVDYLSAIPTVSHSAAMHIILRVGSLVPYIMPFFWLYTFYCVMILLHYTAFLIYHKIKSILDTQKEP